MISAHKTNLAAHVLESPPRTEASKTAFFRNENLMQSSHSLEISHPGGVYRPEFFGPLMDEQGYKVKQGRN